MLLQPSIYYYHYRNQDIPYTVWRNDDDAVVEAILFLGTVQVGKLPEWIATQCPPRTAIVQGAPHWHAKAEGSDIPAFVRGFTESAYANIMNDFCINSPVVIADSQAAPAVISLLADLQHDCGQLILLQPLGLNAREYGKTDTERITTLKKRILSNARHQFLSFMSDKRLRYSHRLLRKIVNSSSSSAIMQYTAGLRYDILPELRQLHASLNITVICGAHDTLFPANEIRENLQIHDLAIEIMTVASVPHSSLASRQGKRLLTRAFEVLEKQGTASKLTSKHSSCQHKTP